MKSYFIIVNGEKKGPLQLEELVKNGLQSDTLVYHKGLSNWTLANEVPELQSLLGDLPPPFSSTTQKSSDRSKNIDIENKPPKPKTWLVEAILSTICCCMITGIVSIVYSSKIDSLYYKGEYERAEQASQHAKTWFIVSICIGVILIILNFMLGFFTEIVKHL
ncbi:CD225/dispanin family protein [Halosquirtibacter laminarini]|uniref:CD225/dispanin family protein n=1 Tax=Halosquirtibacter laminarini TaxID=3374600 RepID=A0AC61NHQ7_9BACT|nr:CD225/dispanin family protein [Prolixibacteraceae bacterium]